MIMAIGLNPSKRYTKAIAEKEASDLIGDIAKALQRKGVSTEVFFKTLESFAEFIQKMSSGMGSCKECRISYSNGKVEGFCEKHETLREEFQKMIDKTLRD
jgi:hypothetical protein